ncbi:unnamed protein product [Absidia cylindrospora]
MRPSSLFCVIFLATVSSSFSILEKSQHEGHEVNTTIINAKPLSGKFLHITDIHVDPNYLPGSSPKKHCHRKSKHYEKNTAGKFGTLSSACDSPLSLVDASFQFMKESLQDIDFIIYTGDTSRHDRDSDLRRTEVDILEDHKTVVHYFKKAYDVSSIKLIPTIGGYFIQDDVIPGLRIININSMFFFKKNIAISTCDQMDSPGSIQMVWIKEKLELAKKDNMMVYIMGHVPPNDDDGELLFTASCHSQYYQLLGEYGDIIAGHFTGHTNNDMLTAVVPTGETFGPVSATPDENSLRVLNVGHVSTMLFNAPSIIPVNNPAIRIYNYETAHGKGHPFGTILDWDQYYVDLNRANQVGKISYELEYRASELYGVNKFDAIGVSRAFKQLRVNRTARKKYSRYVTVSKS